MEDKISTRKKIPLSPRKLACFMSVPTLQWPTYLCFISITASGYKYEQKYKLKGKQDYCNEKISCYAITKKKILKLYHRKKIMEMIHNLGKPYNNNYLH